ncbi:MAG TPA: hypothetical protein VHV78_12870, partial [Gemmatimonadaceae bacterium]|nr:hypothetical protein [Gemmatimonadaceae bacterium]
MGSPRRLETARGVAELLTQHGTSEATAGETTAYSGFAEQFITIPTQPVVTPRESRRPDRPKAPARTLGARAKDFVPHARDRTTFDANDQTAVADLDIAFMRDQLVGYETASERVPYRTIELTGPRATRRSNGGGPDARR